MTFREHRGRINHVSIAEDAATVISAGLCVGLMFCITVKGLINAVSCEAVEEQHVLQRCAEF